MTGGLFLLVLLFAVVAPLVLYALVRDERERDRETVAGWDDAERAARKDDGGSDAAEPNAQSGDWEERNSWDRRD